MSKFHINRKGDATQCRATKGGCPFGDETEHYATRSEAQEAYERDKAFDTFAKVTSKSHKETLQAELNELLEARAVAQNKWADALKMVPSPSGIGSTVELSIPQEEYDGYRKEYSDLSQEADLKAKELRAFNGLQHWESHFPQAHNLEEARMVVMRDLNKGYRENYFADNIENNVEETLDRYHSGEKLTNVDDPLPSDKLLKVLTDDSNSIMSTQTVYSVLVFPEKDLKPVLDRLGVDNVRVDPLVNGRENGLVYTVKDAYGETRSFCIYEHRNTDSLIINGRENWDPSNSDDPLPYAGTTKEDFFAEFGPGDYHQAAETLGYFMKSAQRGDLESDRDLVQMVSRRDWKAILSESIPGYAEWVEDQERKRNE